MLQSLEIKRYRMAAFRYTLDKSSQKYQCPNCHKKTFVRYVDNEKGEYLNGNFGRCDRESKCNYYNPPPTGNKCYLICFLSIKSITDKAYEVTDPNGNISLIPKSQVLERNGNSCWITEWFLSKNDISYLTQDSKYFISSESVVNTVSTVPTVPTVGTVGTVGTVRIQPEKSSFHKLKLLDQMYNDQPVIDNLSTFLKYIFTEEQVFIAMQSYFLTGTYTFWNNATVFWQIDNQERIHAGKVMLYHPSTGKRIKQPYNHINWIHNGLKEPDFSLNQCLFGLHRIVEDYNKSIAIVESEKTALIMSIILPEVLWLATGSKQNLKLPLLEPLVRRKIILYPDKGEYDDWNRKAEKIKESGFKIEVSDILENTVYDPGFDLADYYLATLK